jgi:hypothetical protein
MIATLFLLRVDFLNGFFDLASQLLLLAKENMERKPMIHLFGYISGNSIFGDLRIQVSWKTGNTFLAVITRLSLEQFVWYIQELTTAIMTILVTIITLRCHVLIIRFGMFTHNTPNTTHWIHREGGTVVQIFLCLFTHLVGDR